MARNTQMYRYRPAPSRDRAEVRAKDGRQEREMRKAVRDGTRKRDKLSRAKQSTSRRVFTPHIKRDPSIRALPSWTLVGVHPFAALKPLSAARLPPVEDVRWVGQLAAYESKFERVTKTARPELRSFPHEHTYSTVDDDPVLEEMVDEGYANVIISDAVLAHLMTCPLSVFPWDLRVKVYCTKGDGSIVGVVIDARDPVKFEMLSVNETAPVPPPEKDPTNANGQHWLSTEATAAEQHFRIQCLKAGQRPVTTLRVSSSSSSASSSSPSSPVPGAAGGGGGGAGDAVHEVELEPNPLLAAAAAGGAAAAADNKPTAPQALRYRIFNLGEVGDTGFPVRLGVRTRVHAYVPSTSASRPDQLLHVHSLLECPVPPGGGAVADSWRKIIDDRPSAVLAGENKTNAFLISRWVALALVAGVDEIKVGFVSRVVPSNNRQHEILNALSVSPASLVGQLGLDPLHMWGIVRWFIATIHEAVTEVVEAKRLAGLTAADGEEDDLEGYFFVVRRDPNEPKLQIAAVPSEADLAGATGESTSDTLLDSAETADDAPPAAAASGAGRGAAAASGAGRPADATFEFPASASIGKWLATQFQ
jgi:translation initiation factor 3 subunit D